MQHADGWVVNTNSFKISQIYRLDKAAALLVNSVEMIMA